MASQVTTYRCPACDGPLRFDGAKGRLVCDYCESTFTVEEVEKFYEEKNRKAAEAFRKEQEKQAAAQQAASQSGTTAYDPAAGQQSNVPESDVGPHVNHATAAGAAAGMAGAAGQAASTGDGWDASTAGSDWGAEAQQLKTYNCTSCGAQLVTDTSTAATSCPYCGNPTIIPGQFSGMLKPDYVIPFKLDKKAAVQALSEHYKGKKLLPREFKDQNHIEEIKGVYVPFWLFDSTVIADVQLEATTSTSTRTRNEEIVTTNHYDIRRSGSMNFNGLPVDASTKMPDDYMDSLEPYDYGELKEFNFAYLPGFLADKYDVSVEESAPRAEERMKNTTAQTVRDSVRGYQTVNITHADYEINRGNLKYALMPV